MMRLANSKWTRPFLNFLIGSIVVGALLGIVMILRNTWSSFEVNVILTTITIAIGSLGGLASDLARKPEGSNLLPRTGLALVLISSAMFLIVIWMETGGEEDWLWMGACSFTILAIATNHVCLLSMIPLSGHYRWVFIIAMQVIYCLALLLIVTYVFDIAFSPFLNAFLDSFFGGIFEGIFLGLHRENHRIIAVLTILDVALTLAIPLIYRLNKSQGRIQPIEDPSVSRGVHKIDEALQSLRERISQLEREKADLVRHSETLPPRSG